MITADEFGVSVKSVEWPGYGAVDGRNYVFYANVTNPDLTSREDHPYF